MQPVRDAVPSQSHARKVTTTSDDIGTHSNNGCQTERPGDSTAVRVISTILSGLTVISIAHIIAAPLKWLDVNLYRAHLSQSKESFAVLMTTITQWWAPTPIHVTGDDSMKAQIFQMKDGSLRCNFPHRLVIMANHQLYTDWLYLWWIAYTNRMHGNIYIILKESLGKIPVLGWIAHCYNFIFLSRKWETDKNRFKDALDKLKDPKDKMWLLMFPEGTNLSAMTRAKSAAWSRRVNIPDMKHQLLPRTTGLQYCLSELQASTNWLYDCTIAYEGIPTDTYGQDVFTLRTSFLENGPPRSVNMYWRRFKIRDIPAHDSVAFERWLISRWREKDYLLEYWNKFGTFPELSPADALLASKGRLVGKHAKHITTEVKGPGRDDFLRIFGSCTRAPQVSDVASGVPNASREELAPITETCAFVDMENLMTALNFTKSTQVLERRQRSSRDKKGRVPRNVPYADQSSNNLPTKSTVSKSIPQRKDPQAKSTVNAPVRSSQPLRTCSTKIKTTTECRNTT